MVSGVKRRAPSPVSQQSRECAHTLVWRQGPRPLIHTQQALVEVEIWSCEEMLGQQAEEGDSVPLLHSQETPRAGLLWPTT